MAEIWPKIIRDPIHDIISFNENKIDKLLLELINAKEFQRLRRIKQLGMSDLVFPGANHSRFSHSIGVMHTARMCLDQIERLKGIKLPDEDRVVILVAALLHDVGHGPFSHAFEHVTKDKHEKRTKDIILDNTTEIYSILEKFDRDLGLPHKITDFFDTPSMMTNIVSSQLDADRFDYLLRDSHMTGTDYGNFDLNWLIHHLCVDESKKRIYLSRKAFSVAEAYIFARYHMYRVVYFHKVTRSAEVMLRLIFKRYKELLDAQDSQVMKRNIVPAAPLSVFHAFSQSMSLGEYLLLDDYAITEFFKACIGSKDPILQPLGDGLVNRRLYKCVDTTDAEATDIANFKVRADRAVEKAGKPPEYALVDDTAADTPYKPYDPDDEKPATQIYVETSTGERIEISKHSDPVAQLTKKYSLVRYYFPVDIREEIAKIEVDTLRRGGKGKSK